MIHLYTLTEQPEPMQTDEALIRIQIKCENCKHWNHHSYVTDKEGIIKEGDCQAITMISEEAYIFGTAMEDPAFITHKDFGCSLFEIKKS